SHPQPAINHRPYHHVRLVIHGEAVGGHEAVNVVTVVVAFYKISHLRTFHRPHHVVDTHALSSFSISRSKSSSTQKSSSSSMSRLRRYAASAEYSLSTNSLLTLAPSTPQIIANRYQLRA